MLIYDIIERHLRNLIPKLGLDDRYDQIMLIYKSICKESLAFQAGKDAIPFSRINEDGLPFQFGLSLDSLTPRLKILSEVGIPGSPNIERFILSRQRINYLTSILYGKEKQILINSILDRVAPIDNPDLISDNAGAFWIGCSFSQKANPLLKVYINGKWANENKIWDRLKVFSEFFEYENWNKIKNLTNNEMKPLGMSVSIPYEGDVHARIYLSSYNSPLSYYMNLFAKINNNASVNIFEKFTELFLDRHHYNPIKLIVCSFGLKKKFTGANFRLEVCGHCTFDSDLEAYEKCLEWLKFMNFNTSSYTELVGILSSGKISKTLNGLHSFISLGIEDKRINSNIYAKPNLMQYVM